MARLEKCPVCDSKAPLSGFKCDNCGFELAFVRLFASDQTRDLWRASVETYKEEYQQTLKAQEESERVKNIKLAMTRDKISFLDLQTGDLSVVYSDGRKRTDFKNVHEYIANENNELILYKDNHMVVNGDNSYGQCNISNNTNIVSATTTGLCILAVYSDGTVGINGAIPDSMSSAIRTWQNVQKIACSDKLIVALTNDGGLLYTKNDIDIVISSTGNIKDVCVYNDECIALKEDGRVEYFGKSSDKAGEISGWSRIKSIAIGANYAVALDESSQVFMAGSAKNKLLDAGRSEARQWSGVSVITCSKTAIAGVTNDNKMLIAGKFGKKAEQIDEERNS